MTSKKIISTLMLTLAAMIWGLAFVAQSMAMESLGPFSVTCLRAIIGGTFLLIFISIKDRGKIKKAEIKETPLILGGICCGTAFFLGATFQQHGLMQTSVGKAGFITTLYIIIVPILGIFLKRKVGANIWFSMLIAMFGTYFLCMTNDFSINKGDIYLLIGAIFFSFHILLVGHFSSLVDGVKMAFIQLIVSGIISFIPMMIFESLDIASIKQAIIPLLYAGILSSGVAFTMQIVAQKNISPVVASLVMSLESVFSVLAGWVILKQVLTPKEVFGCVLVFVAVILAQIPDRTMKKSEVIPIE